MYQLKVIYFIQYLIIFHTYIFLLNHLVIVPCNVVIIFLCTKWTIKIIIIIINNVIKWFNKIPDKSELTFFKFDIVSFYPSISEKLRTNALAWANKITDFLDISLNLESGTYCPFRKDPRPPYMCTRGRTTPTSSRRSWPGWLAKEYLPYIAARTFL